MAQHTNSTSALSQLEEEGLVDRDGDVLRTSKRWQAAMARAAVRLYEAGDPGEDLRVPIGSALLELYGPSIPDESLVDLIEAMLPVELAALGIAPAAVR